MKYTLYGEEARGVVIKAITSLNVGKPWTVEIKRKTKQRSLNQNSLLHKWIGIIAEDTGDSQASMKADLKAVFAIILENKVTQVKFRPMDTSEMTTVQMTEFMDRIYGWATSEMGIILPIPEDRAA